MLNELKFKLLPATKMMVCYLILSGVIMTTLSAQHLKLNELEYFEKRGVNVMVFSNAPGGLFNDAKTTGLEIVHHGIRTATNGDVRLQRTPEQWDPLSSVVERKVSMEANTIEMTMEYAAESFRYKLQGTVSDRGTFMYRVILDEPLPSRLHGHAGLNLEFNPAEYFGRTYLADNEVRLFPRYPSGLMDMMDDGTTQPRPMATGKTMVLAPDDLSRLVSIQSTSDISIYDGRTKAQNGWFVVRTEIPSGVTGTVVEWEIEIHGIQDWVRKPNISHSQVGYHPSQRKTAVIELDKNDISLPEATLYRVESNGSHTEVLRTEPIRWGQYLRFNYLKFDFSNVTESGVYVLRYGDVSSGPIRISPNVYDDVWHLTLDQFMPIQMDHMKVREAYRTWHGASHLDDALQAPINYEHFDLYAMPDTTDTRFEPFEHIPGINIGGWYDAGDYDIRTQSQYQALQYLIHARERFGIDRDNTTVSQEKRYVEIHLPDGKPDILQQIEHGILFLISHYRAIGHAIPGIVEAHLYQYPHLGDGITKTDNFIYKKELDPFADQRAVGAMFLPSTDHPRPDQIIIENDGTYSGHFDDRWAFTTHTTALNYGSAAALAGASRVLRGYNDKLAEECLQTAIRVWDFEQNNEPALFQYGNTTGGHPLDEELKATVELLITTGDKKYSDRLKQMLPELQNRFFGGNAFMLLTAIKYMDSNFREEVRTMATRYASNLGRFDEANPFGVPITEGGWAGNGAIMGFGVTNYMIYKEFPDLVDPDYVIRSLDYLFGTRPASNISFVSAVGAQSQTVAYGMNRADLSFVPGGIVPGVLVLPPDLPENRENWPFFWGQNEYVIPMGPTYIFLAHAVVDVLRDTRPK